MGVYVLAKIIATLGPASFHLTKEMDEYVDMYRINLSHAPLDTLQECLHRIHKASDIPVCIDTEGSQLRTGDFGLKLNPYRTGDYIKITDACGDKTQLSLTPRIDLKLGDVITTCNTEFTMESCDFAKVTMGGTVEPHKAASLSREIELASITVKDKSAINIAEVLGVQTYLLSFTEHPKDILDFRALISNTKDIFAKIESTKGIAWLKEIEEISDALLIDRHDMSREIGLIKTAFNVREIIKKSRKPVYVSVDFSFTTEHIGDITGLIDMGAQGLLLTKDTAAGPDPVGTVKHMRELCS